MIKTPGLKLFRFVVQFLEICSLSFCRDEISSLCEKWLWESKRARQLISWVVDGAMVS